MSADDELLIPEGSLLLHIGPPKTGSTATQQAMHVSRAILREHGVLYPGTSQREREASWAVLGQASAVGRRPARQERWQRLVDEVRNTDLSRVFLSHENFAHADEAAVDRILEGLGSEHTHVVFVARRLDKLLPSHWNERVKAWETMSYDDYLHRMLADELEPFAAHIWGAHDVHRAVTRWATRVGHDNFTVIVSDERDRSRIPRTFEAMLGLPEGLLVPPSNRSNVSLGYTATEAVRAVNRKAREEGWSPREYWRLVQIGAVHRLREGSFEDTTRIAGLPDWAAGPVAALAERQIHEIRSAGVQVIGDPEVLRFSEQEVLAELPPPVESVPLDLVADVVQGVVDGAAELRRRERRSQERQRRQAATEQLGGRQLLQLLARRTAARLGVRHQA